MLPYILRRIAFSVPLLIGVNVITFTLFFCVNSPTDIAYKILGDKHVHPVNVYRFKVERMYHLPYFWHTKKNILWVGSFDFEAEIVFAHKQHTHMNWEDIHAGSDFLSQSTQNTIIVFQADPLLASNVTEFLKEALVLGVPVIEYRSREAKGIWEGAVTHVDRELGLISAVSSLTPKGIEMLTKTLFFKKSLQFLWFDFGTSDRNHVDIGREMKSRVIPSLMITVPAFIMGLLLEVSIALWLAYNRGKLFDKAGLFILAVMISIMSLFYMFCAHWLFGVFLKWFPVSGFKYGVNGIPFVLLPIMVAILDSLAGGIRFYRTLFLEEFEKEYVKTAYVKALAPIQVVFWHILPNVMLPIVTNTVAVIPRLFMGSLILEYFFAIPGLGGFTLEGILAEDFAIVGAMTFLGAFLYVAGLLLTDICYAYVDPRVRIGK